MDTGWIALNSDGAVKGSGKASAGGLVRDDRGCGGFMVNIGRASVLHAEGVKEGLCFARHLGVPRLMVGIDSRLFFFSAWRWSREITSTQTCCGALFSSHHLIR